MDRHLTGHRQSGGHSPVRRLSLPDPVYENAQAELRAWPPGTALLVRGIGAVAAARTAALPSLGQRQCGEHGVARCRVDVGAVPCLLGQTPGAQTTLEGRGQSLEHSLIDSDARTPARRRGRSPRPADAFGATARAAPDVIGHPTSTPGAAIIAQIASTLPQRPASGPRRSRPSPSDSMAS